MKWLIRPLAPYRLYFLVLAIIVILFGLRSAWNEVYPFDKSFHAIDGIIDLRGTDLASSSPLTLDGQWEWYPGQLMSEQQVQEDKHPRSSIQVPGNWRAELNSDATNAYGYGTYRLRILTDRLEQPVAFWFKGIQASSLVEINGNIIGGAGHVAEAASEYVPSNTSYSLSYTEKGATEIDLLIRTANFHAPFSGGITRSVRFGTETAIDDMSQRSLLFQILTVGILLLHGMYACIVYFYRRKDTSLFFTGLFFLFAGVTVSSGFDKSLFMWLPFDYTWTIRIRPIALLWKNMFLQLVFMKSTGISWRGRGMKIYIAVLAGLTAGLLVAPASVVNSVVDLHIFLVVYLLSYILFIGVVVKAVFKKQADNDLNWLLVAAISTFSNLTWVMLDSFREVTSVYYPIDIMVAVIAFSTHWFKKYSRNADEISELYEQLKIADKIKDRFLANTSHELRTPLHGIMNIAGNLYEREKDNLTEGSRQEMELLGTISRRMSYLLDDLLDVVRLRDHRISLQLEPLRAQAIVPGVIAMLQYMAEGKPIMLHMNITESLPPVMADEKRLVQILYNLLHNALKYTERGSITLSAEVRSGQAVIEIADTGIGMDEETQARIFMPYEQAVYGIGDGRGIGLGLSICKQLVDLHGGELSVDSALSRGSTFRVTLPLADRTAQSLAGQIRLAERETATATQPYEGLRAEGREIDGRSLRDAVPPLLHGDNIRLLVVDDDPINLKVLAGILESEPFQIVTAHSGEEALQLLEQQSWDLVIADVMMPGMSGYHLTQRVRERYSVSELPVLLMTARSQSADIYTGFLAGANDYVTKPADAIELRCRIRSLIALKRSIQDRLRMEAAYLQAQIQPHFLFNTLNALMVLSKIDTTRMQKLGEAFTSYLRISFDYMNTGEKVELAHELALVEAYLHIEKERFGDKLEVVRKIEKGVRVSLPPLSIQPLVENAIRHGLLSKGIGGTVQLRIARLEDGILIEVKDNGVGLSSDRIEKLLNPSLQEQRGIGIVNTNRRLIQLYGHGLSFESKLGEGTTVSFVVPTGRAQLIRVE
ncbi:ATP-binding protein [Paenibacillus oryzisoli]|uniref:histidine kinase n=1 Tax=Paenibacillus oryzisoli TaxID=1850517 RepID=A0A197ZX28_9BACL|nr:ATP-binding protein [Paenibacillus oryzisoli]OAS13283.1 histidine kinase [Paenibacillus oryzisoli]